VAVGFLGYRAVTEQRLESLERVERMLEGDIGGRPGYTRADIYASLPRYIAAAPLLGNGTGSWPVIAQGQDVAGWHPHNLFAELQVEGGLVAVALFLVVLGVTFRPASFARLRSDPQALCAVMLFANTFLNAMVSADLPGNRAVFLMIGVLALLAVRPSGAAVPVSHEVARPFGSAAPAAVMRRMRLGEGAKTEP
jgi:O-antigen ligase